MYESALTMNSNACDSVIVHMVTTLYVCIHACMYVCYMCESALKMYSNRMYVHTHAYFWTRELTCSTKDSGSISNAPIPDMHIHIQTKTGYIYIYIYTRTHKYFHAVTHVLCQELKDSIATILFRSNAPISDMHIHIQTKTRYIHIYTHMHIYMHMHILTRELTCSAKNSDFTSTIIFRSNAPIPGMHMHIQTKTGYIHTNIYIHIHIYVCMYLYTHKYFHAVTHVLCQELRLHFDDPFQVKCTDTENLFQWLYVYVCVCMYVCMYFEDPFQVKCTGTKMYICMYVCNVYMYVCMHTNVCIYICMCNKRYQEPFPKAAYVYVYVCMHTYVCIYICMCNKHTVTYMHVYTRRTQIRI
jgi:hypothetical protein